MMTKGTNRQLQLQRKTSFILVLLLASLMGCSKPANTKTAPASAPPELAGIQGNWLFDEARYLEMLRLQFPNPEDFKKFAAFHEIAKQHGTAAMTDISISGARITTTQGLIRQQFDLSSCRLDSGRITAKALWHEDLNDSGDAVTLDVALQNDGTNLVFTITSEGTDNAYTFKRK